MGKQGAFNWDTCDDLTYRMFEQTVMIRAQQDGKYLTKWPSPVPHPEGKKTLCLDLDDTLVHFTVDPDEIELYSALHASDPPFIASCPCDGSWGRLFLRPNVWRFLHGCREKFEMVAFTASERGYAQQLVERLGEELFDQVFTREHCFMLDNGGTTKDLRVIGRPLSDIILLDDQLSNFAAQPDNGILCRPYNATQAHKVMLARQRAALSTGSARRRSQGEDDDGLAEVIHFLQGVADAEDVRTYLRERLGLGEMLKDFEATQMDVDDVSTRGSSGSRSPSVPVLAGAGRVASPPHAAPPVRGQLESPA